MRLPEFRITNRGAFLERVEWDSCRDGEPIFDITGMHVTRVERICVPGEVPTVKVTFRARLVEIEEPTVDA